MKRQKQVCSIEQAKRLIKLGIAIDSIFLYVINWLNPRCEPVDDGELIILDEQQHIFQRKGELRGAQIEFVSAFTVAELGQMLPDKFNSQGFEHGDNADMSWFCRNERVDTFPYCELSKEPNTPVYSRNKELVPDTYGATEAIARAAMLIHLLEKGYFRAEEVNKRLKF